MAYEPINLEKLEKRVRELETDLKTENAELRHNLNLVIDAVNNITKIWNEAIGDDDEQAMEDNEVLPEAIGEQSMKDNEVLTLPQDEHPQLTLQQVYNMYQSQRRDEEGWEEMTNAIEAAEKYEASLPIRTNGLTQEEWNDLLKI